MYYKFKKVVMSIIISLLMIFLVSCGTMEVSTNLFSKHLFDNQVFNYIFSLFWKYKFFPIVRTSIGENAYPKKFKLFF